VQQAVAQVTVSPKTARATTFGQLTLFSARVVDASGNPMSVAVTWSSSDPAVATVNSSGNARALARGLAAITATVGGKSDEATLVVTPIALVLVTADASTIDVGEITEVHASLADAAGFIVTPNVNATWTSSNPAIATVNSSGVVTGVSPGTVTITGMANGYSFKADLTLTVVSPPGGGAIPNTVLIYGPSLDTVSGDQNEKTLAEAAGMTVTVANASAWSSMTTADFAKYSVIVFPDPPRFTHSDSASCATSRNKLSTAEANKSIWAAAVKGRMVVFGTAPIAQQKPGGLLMTKNAITWAGSSGSTGLVVQLGCYYYNALPATPVSILSPFGLITAYTKFVASPNMANLLAPEHPVMQGVTSASLSNWNDSVYEVFTVYPASFQVLAISNSLPYIIAKP
jgi:hypothetical protein